MIYMYRVLFIFLHSLLFDPITVFVLHGEMMMMITSHLFYTLSFVYLKKHMFVQNSEREKETDMIDTSCDKVMVMDC